MARIDDLLSELPESEPKTQIIEELARFRKKIGFGVKWEEHEEYIPLWGLPIEVGSTVVRWNLPYVIRDDEFQEHIVQEIIPVAKLTQEQLQQLLEDDIQEHTKKEDDLMARIEDLGGCISIRPCRGGETELVLTRTVVRIEKGEHEIIPLLNHLRTISHPDGEVATTHAVIESENIIALHLLRATHQRSFDLIYLDPPYNARQGDWKYNNDYVDSIDGYKHSKWMSFIHHRMTLAKDLLADDGVVVVAIDENEHANLVLMLQKMWPGRKVVSVAIQHNPRGIRGDDFRMNNDFAVFVYSPIKDENRISHKQRAVRDDRSFMKYNLGDNEPNRVYPSLYPFIINPDGTIIDVGEKPDVIPVQRNVLLDNGNIEVWPFDSNGNTRTWSNGRETAQQRITEGIIYAENKGKHWDIRKITSSNPHFSLWADNKYDNKHHGDELLGRVFAKGDRFPFPKSIYTMTDVILAATRDRPEAKILDFFGGSGTTLHATMMVNEMYGGQRQCILVSAAEVNGKIEVKDKEGNTKKVEHWDHLVSQGHTPIDDEWLQAGVIRSETLPRLDYFVRGVRHDGTAIDGNYVSGYNYHANREIEYLQIPQAIPPSLVKDLTLEVVGHAHPIYVSQTKRIAALWDAGNAKQSKEFINQISDLPQNTKLERIFIRTDDVELFENLRTQIQDALVNIPEVQENTREMSLGFPSQSIECFQVEFQARNAILYNENFEQLLPVLIKKPLDAEENYTLR